ncbi:ArnT family glycosyltransferase [Tahibacter amnicola]|uniref:Glycosyltransferase family 39 protein n=1 Tax=Tahibacter amnicola TaxID=2976241 RepID=A0ABY6BM48_9GAMM|nr:glycosyltransferase family 39 protein [Tahibacter amnicola]UXI69641.1 glycosyltransferase family 39 protein [Tahibacter amnicola]
MPIDRSVATAGALPRGWRLAAIILWALLAVSKCWVAATLAPFGDEAFYWQESRALAWSYTDVPPATAVLIRLGETLFGHSPLGMRSLFLLLGALMPLWIWRIGARHFGEERGAQAAVGWMALPLGATLGVMAMPDVPLTIAAIGALAGLLAAVTQGGWRAWVLVGVSLAVAWFSHYRAAMLLLGGAVFLLGSAHGRAQFRRPGLWLALAIAATGLVPLVLFNASHDWHGMSFQFVERHPWRFQWSGLAQLVEQTIASTPLLYGVMLLALWRGWRQRDADPRVAVLACSGVGIALGYLLFGLFADDVRFRVHWPLPAYVAAVLLVPLLLDLSRRHAQRWVYGLGVIGTGLATAYLAMAAHPASIQTLAEFKLYPQNFVGWREAGAETRHLLRADPSALLVADNFLLAAELDFQLAGPAVYSLDHIRNVKHGRAGQLRIWQRDEAGLAARSGSPVLLVVEETSKQEGQAQWLQNLCRHVADLTFVQRLRLYGGRKIFSWYRGRVPGPQAPAQCAADNSG